MKKQHISTEIPERVSVIGIPISVVTMDGILSFVSECLEDIRGEYICASNVHTTVMAREDKVYFAAQRDSIISLPDGQPIYVVGRKQTKHPMGKVRATQFMMNTFTDARFIGKKHYFYGTGMDNLNKMIEKVRLDYPKLNICGYEPSVFRELSDLEVEELAQRINEAQADFIWVAIGAPRQELLMQRLKGKVNGVMTGVGGAFNILSGIVNDAPVWMQNIGMEWLYRLLKEPKRLFKRYLVTNTKFIAYVFWETIKKR